jgi:hypothetical protein
VLPALSLDGVLAVRVLEGSVDHIDFEEFLEELLQSMEPFPGRNSVLVMDNASIHKNEDIMDLVED